MMPHAGARGKSAFGASTPVSRPAMLPPMPPSPKGQEPERSQRISLVEGSLATVHITITTGSLVTAYAFYLGARDFQIGLLAALTALSTMGSVLAAQWIGLLGRRKPLTVATSVLGRALWAVLCLLPFLHLSPGLRLALLLAGGREASGLAWIFGTAGLFAVLAGISLCLQWEPPLSGERPRPLAEILRLPLAEQKFRRLLVFLICWSMAIGVAGPFYVAHMIRNLKMPFSTIALYSIIAGTVTLGAQPVWGRIIDRLGNRPVLILNLCGLSCLPLLWVLATPGHALPIWIDAFLTGIFWPGFTLATFNLVLATAPEEGRTSYLGMYSLATGVFAFLASSAAGALAEALSGFHHRILGLNLVNLHLLFVLTTILRLALVPAAFGLSEERAQSVGALMDLLGDGISRRVQSGLQIGGLIIKKMGRP
jgi:hypothetical protein